MLIEALGASLSADNSTHQAAHAYLLEMRSNQGSFPSFLECFVSGSTDLEECHYELLLSVMYEWVKQWWNQISQDDQAYVRDGMISILQNLPAVILDSNSSSSNNGVRNRFAMIFANIASRQFPQLWPDFLDTMEQFWTHESSSWLHRIICVSTIEMLVQECVDTGFNNMLPTQRKQDIMAGIREKLEALLTLIFTSLAGCASSYNELSASNNDNGGELDNVIVFGNILLKLANKFTMCSKITEIFTADHNFAEVAVSFLTCGAYQIEAANFLSTIVSKKEIEEDFFAYLLQSIGSTPIEVVPPDSQEKSLFLCTYAESVFSLLHVNAGYLTDKSDKAFLRKAEENAVSLSNYFALMVTILEQKSKRIAGEVLPLAIKLLAEDGIQRVPWMEDISTMFLKAYSVHGRRVVWRDESPVAEHDKEDFEEYTDYFEYRNMVNGQINLLSQTVVRKFPIQAIQYITSTMDFLIQEGAFSDQEKAMVNQTLISAVNMPLDAALKTINAEIDNCDIVLKWDSLFISFDTIIQGSIAQIQATPERYDCLQASMNQLFQWFPDKDAWNAGRLTDAEHILQTKLAIYRLKCLQLMALLFKLANTYLVTALKTVLDAITSLAGIYTSNAPMGHTRLLVPAMTKQCAITLANICNACAHEIVHSENSELTPQTLVDQLQYFLTAEGIPVDFKSSLSESIIGLSGAVTDADSKTQLIVQALSGPMQHLKELNETIFQSTESFLKMCFSDESSPLDTIRNINATLETLCMSAKRVANPLLPSRVWNDAYSISDKEVGRLCPFLCVWKEVFPILSNFCRTVHGIADPAIRQQMSQHADMQDFYAPTSQELRFAAKLDALSPTTATPLTLVGPLYDLKLELSSLRHHIYQLLGQACSHKAIYVIPNGRKCIQDMLDVIPFLENNQVSGLMVRVIEPYVLNALPCMYSEVATFLSDFLPKVMYRLGIAYGHTPVDDNGEEARIYKYCSMPVSGEYGGLCADSMEIVTDYFIRDLARKLSDILSSFGLCRGYLAPQPIPLDSKKSGDKKGMSSSPSHKGGVTYSHSDPALAKLVEDSLIARRARMKDMMLGAANYSITNLFVSSIAFLYSLPDSHACKKAITLTKLLIETSLSVKDGRYLEVVGKDCFTGALMVLMHAEMWSAGLEWELVDVLQEIYSSYVLTLAIGVNSVEEAKQYTKREPLTILPRSYLLENGVNEQAIIGMEEKVVNSMQLKKRRQHFKDFLSELIKMHKQGNGNGNGNGTSSNDSREYFKKVQPNVSNIYKAKKNANAPHPQVNFDVSSLFEE